MKSLKLLLSVLALTAFAAAPALRAEDAPANAGAPAKKMHPGDRIKELTEKLSLTDEQVAKIKPILADEMAAMKALHEDNATDKDAKKEKFMEIRKSHADQILAILTPEQQAKFKDMIAKHGKGDGPKKKKGPASDAAPAQ